ncbi:MAG: CHAT domain-containing protein [Anaerolineae bacterium]|nr:CHAT domain-containing protein [Anaerolineae bacterium]
MLARLATPPRLVFLSACQTATPSTSRAYLGLGVALVQAGVPAVVAMREAIAIPTAQALTRTFYDRLAAHCQVDLALNEARSHLLTAQQVGAAVPILCMRLKSGELQEEITMGESTTNKAVSHKQAILIDNGAISQGSGDALGAGAVKVGNGVGRDVVTGTKNTMGKVDDE